VRPVTGPEMVCIKAVIQSAAKAVTHHEDDHKQQQFNRLILNVFLFFFFSFDACAFSESAILRLTGINRLALAKRRITSFVKSLIIPRTAPSPPPAFSANAGRITLNNPESQPLPTVQLKCMIVQVEIISGSLILYQESRPNRQIQQEGLRNDNYLYC
jgi:hypothetical protein